MNKIFHRSLMAAFLWIGLAALPNSASATHQWGSYHWARTSNPFTLKLGDNVSSGWDSYLATASSDWSLSTVMDTTTVTGGAGNPRRCSATTGRVEVCNTTYGNTGWLGVASIWISGDHITRGTVKLNDTYFNTATYNTSAWRRLVMCQEVGHTFGLDHQDEIFTNPNLGTCMDYTNDPDGKIYNQLSNEHPNQHDYDELVTIYTHLDSTSTVSQTLAAGNAMAARERDNVDEPERVGTAQWGKLVRSTNHGRTEVFELDLGRGQKMVTFVIWAD
jgi:hypothetical protein